MEQIFGTSRVKKADVFADPSHRMSKRPLAVKSGEGLGFQDFGSSFGPPKHTTNYKTSPKKFKPATTLTSKPRKAPPPISEDESDDELLLSSQGSESTHATSSTKRVAKGDAPSNGEETVHVGGRVLAAHPDFKPSSFSAVKGLRFSKNKKPTPPGDDATEIPLPSSLPDSQELFKPISADVEVVIGPRPRDLSSSRQKPSETSATRHRSPDATSVVGSRSPDIKKFSTSKPSPPIANDTPRKPRPRPRVVIKSVPSSRNDNTESTPRQPQRSRDTLPCTNYPEQHTSGDRNATAKKLPPSRRELQAFPMLLDAKENVLDSDTSPSMSKRAIPSRGPRQIPLPSPLKTKPISREATFPSLSPLSSSIDKGKARATTSDEDNADLSDALGKRSGLQPFPMSSQMLAGIDRRSKSPSNCSYGSVKRASSDDSGNEQGRTAKKRKDSRPGVLDTHDYLYEPMEDDSIDLGYARDPSKMCPYCDEDLPSHPTPHFQHLLATARKKSVSDPRSRNRGGLKAPLTIYISVCQRHRFESHQLPIAMAKGWPKKIDFAKVPERVKMMKKALQAIILDKDDISNVRDVDVDDRSRGPRSKSIFWREVKKQVKKQGIRSVVGVKGQFASFEMTQPGYYGEQGSVIIYQTLFDLFPPSAFDASLIAPLAPAEFIQRILVPEVAVRLIAQDLGVDILEAVVTLRESAQYGVAMFPDTSEHKGKGTNGDDDEMDIADRIVMERARARRKELAEQEKVEEEILEKERAAQRARARESRREKALQRAQQTREIYAHADLAGDASDASKGAARGTRRTGQAITDDSESDAMSVDSATSRRSMRIARKVGKSGSNAAMTKLLRESSDSDSMEVVDDRGYKVKSGRNKTRERAPEPDKLVRVEAPVAGWKKPFTKFTALNNDGDHESTPRPVRERQTDTTTAETVIGSERILPLQIARNRQTSPHDGWSRSLRTGVPDDTDSDASAGSHRLVHAPIRKGTSRLPWLFSSSPSESS